MKRIIALILVGAFLHLNVEAQTNDPPKPNITAQGCWFIVRISITVIAGGVGLYVAYVCTHEKPHKPIPLNTPVRVVLKKSGMPNGGEWTPFMTNPPPVLPPLVFTATDQEHEIFDFLHSVTATWSEYYTAVLVDTNYAQVWP